MSTNKNNQQDKNRQPLISFIITYFNIPVELLKECIDSILSLSLSDSDREIILIDDGSEYSLINDLKMYNNRINYIRQTNKGVSAARNIGISVANGKYIQFVDGDDYLIKSVYEQCLNIAKYNNADIVLFNSTNRKAKDARYTVNSISKTITGTEYMLYNNLRSPVWGYIFKKSILCTLRFTPGIIHEDEEFTPLLFLKAEKVIVTNSTAYFYRRRSDSIMHRKDKEWIQKRLFDMKNVIHRLAISVHNTPENDRPALQRRVAQLTMDYLYNIIVLTKSESYLNKSILKLQSKGLFPLPNKSYSTSYTLFSRMINNKISRKIVCNILPYINTYSIK